MNLTFPAPKAPGNSWDLRGGPEPESFRNRYELGVAFEVDTVRGRTWSGALQDYYLAQPWAKVPCRTTTEIGAWLADHSKSFS